MLVFDNFLKWTSHQDAVSVLTSAQLDFENAVPELH